MWNPFKRKGGETNSNKDDEAFEKVWHERLVGLQSLYGKSDTVVGHGVIPFYLGSDVGGTADVVYFKNHIEGRLTVTAELVGNADQKRNSLGNYELAIAHRDENEDWGPNLICRLAHYTLEAVIQPGETMDLAPSVPENSSIDAFLFYEYGRFEFRKNHCGVLLCVGITKKEKEVCLAGETDLLIKALAEKKVFPYTDLFRENAI